MIAAVTMNGVHDVLCSSRWWAGRVERKLLPSGLEDIELGDDVLEVGPGFGATTRPLASQPGRLTAVKLDQRYCQRLRTELGPGVSVVQGDATELPFDAGRFSAVVCFTMLHQIAARRRQDRALAELARVLRPGGTFAGTDSIGSGPFFRLIHLRDTLLLIDPVELPARLRAAGMVAPRVRRGAGTFGFRAQAGVSRL